MSQLLLRGDEPRILSLYCIIGRSRNSRNKAALTMSDDRDGPV